MDNTKSRKRNQNRDEDASSKKKVNTGGSGSWSDLKHRVLYLIMMQLGVVDYFSFGVCKSWRSLAISNRKSFTASKPPMTMRISWRGYEKACYLGDNETGRKFKTILPRFFGGACVGLSCGYLIFFKRTTRDFWLVNPITRHQLYFPDFPMNYYPNIDTQEIKAILGFSRSRSAWVLVVLCKFSRQIWFSTVDTAEWDDVSCTLDFTDLCAFKGKIYTLNINDSRQLFVCKLRLNPEPKPTSFKTKNSLKASYNQQLLSSGENIYVMDRMPEDRYRFQELEFDEMKCVSREKKVGESAYFLSNFKHGVVDIHHFWGLRGQGLLAGHKMGEMSKVMELER